MLEQGREVFYNCFKLIRGHLQAISATISSSHIILQKLNHICSSRKSHLVPAMAQFLPEKDTSNNNPLVVMYA